MMWIHKNPLQYYQGLIIGSLSPWKIKERKNPSGESMLIKWRGKLENPPVELFKGMVISDD